MLDSLCREFGCTPDEAADLDEELTFQVLRARNARIAAATFALKGIDGLTEGQSGTWRSMLDALDRRDRRLGIPEEL